MQDILSLTLRGKMGKIHSLGLLINGLKHFTLNRLNHFTVTVSVSLCNTLALKVLDALGSEEIYVFVEVIHEIYWYRERIGAFLKTFHNLIAQNMGKGSHPHDAQ